MAQSSKKAQDGRTIWQTLAASLCSNSFCFKELYQFPGTSETVPCREVRGVSALGPSVRGGRGTNLKNPPSRGVGGAAGVDKMNVLKALLVKTITMLRTHLQQPPSLVDGDTFSRISAP